MGIVDEDVTKVRDATDIAGLIGEHLALRRVGRRFVGLCPFHQERTPSFSVNPELGLYYCFGCQKSGDAISFVREVEHLDFVGAVERLAARAGITLRYDDRAQDRDRSRRGRLADAAGAALRFYHEHLLQSPDGGPARRYLRSRGFDGDAARRFQLGFAPADWDALSTALQKQGFARDDLVAAGLSFVNRANRLQDQFRGRLMFPIHDALGQPAGFGGRALGEEGPKYKNSPDGPLYQKSRLLYWLHQAKSEIVARDEVVVCEGYTDVMAFDLCGVHQAVATCGTALTDDHVRVLKNLTRRLVLAYDADAAGQGAAERCYRFEQEFEVELLVADLPAGRDPADVWKDDPAALGRAVERARPFLDFRLGRMLASSDLATFEGRARAGDGAVQLVAEHPSDLVRDQYAMQLAEQLHIDVDRLREAIGRARRPGGAGSGAVRERPSDGASVQPVAAVPERIDRRELDVLRWSIHEPEIVADWLDEALFSDPAARAAFTALATSPTLHDALVAADGPARLLLERLAVEVPELDAEPGTIRARLMVNTVVPAAERLLRPLRKADDPAAIDVQRLVDRAVHAEQVGEWADAVDTAEQLVGWVVHAVNKPSDEAGARSMS